MLDGRVLGASQVEYKPFGKPPLKREGNLSLLRSHCCRLLYGLCCATLHLLRALVGSAYDLGGGCGCGPGRGNALGGRT